MNAVAGKVCAIGAVCMLLSCGETSAPVFSSSDSSVLAAMPHHIVAGYFPYWTASPPRVRDANQAYNLIYVFVEQSNEAAADGARVLSLSKPGDGRGAASNFSGDLQYVRGTQGRKIILSVDAAIEESGFRTRADSQKFVKEISTLYSKLGGFDGLDWNTFGAARSVDVGEITWISLELKRKYAGFIITASPAPWNEIDKKFCHAMVLSGAMDYAAPQYYGGSNLADPSYVVNSVAEWSELLGQSHVVVGLGINNAANYMTGLRAMETWTKIETSFPSIRGSSNWDINTDERQGWVFAKSVGSLIKTRS